MLCETIVVFFYFFFSYMVFEVSNRSAMLVGGGGLVLDVNRTRVEIAQTYTHTQRHMNNAWILLFSFFWLVHTNNLN